MIKITCELYPFGDKKLKKTIAEIEIINDGSGTQEIGNYKYHISSLPKFGTVKNFNRLDENVIDLLYKVLKDYFKEK
jgi:hypothetical protein